MILSLCMTLGNRCLDIFFDNRKKLLTKNLCNQQIKCENGSAPGMHHVVSIET